MLQRVWERSLRAESLTRVVIATDDRRILETARAFGASAVMTRADHPSGTDRVAEVARAEDAEVIVNIQGDEPMIEPAAIDAAVQPLLTDETVVMATLKRRFDDPRGAADPNVVKVATDRNGDAIYFSRFAIPFHRDREGDSPPGYFKHIGLYVYRRAFLLGYPALTVGPLERAERLEQLRALENGFRIRVVETRHDSLGVDTAEDLERARDSCRESRLRDLGS